MEKEACDAGSALEKLRNTITKYAIQGALSYRTDEAKMDYLYDTLCGAEWAKPALTQCFSHDPPWSVHQLYTI